jgi:ribosomal protein S7
MQISDIERGAFREIDQNSFVEYTEQEVQRLREIAVELRNIVEAAKKRQHDNMEDQFDPLKAS